MTLGEFYRETYRPVQLVGCSPNTDEQYQIALMHWVRFAGAVQIDASPQAINARLLAKFLGHMVNGRSSVTANKTLHHLMAIVRGAHRDGVFCGEVPTVPKLKEPRRLPEAWTVDDVQLILAEVIKEPGQIDGVPANRWWYSLLLTIYYCGGRITAVRKTSPQDFLLDQRAIILRAEHQKQSADQYLHLPDQVVAAVAVIYSDRRQLVWPWPYHDRTLFKRFARILRRAGVRYGQGRGGLFQKMRRTHASYVAANGGDATFSLGHSSALVTRKHYLDPRIVGRGQVDRLPRLEVDSPDDDSRGGNPAWRV